MAMRFGQQTEFATEAAYAVVVGLDQTAPDTDDDIEANLRFARMYPQDVRAEVCQLNAASALFESGRFLDAYHEAIVARELTENVDSLLIINRLLAHSAFQLKDYQSAERSYAELLERGEPMQDELLASVYKQGELAEGRGELAEATHHYKRLDAVAPDATLTRDAAYDIAALYEGLGQPLEAISQLKRYRSRYSDMDESLKVHISARLIALLESNSNLLGAASELVSLAQNLTGEKARESRYRAAQLFLEGGQLDSAIEHFRYYAHNYKQPSDLRLEAMHHMDSLYLQTN